MAAVEPSGCPSGPVTTILSPCEGLGAGKLAGWTGRSRTSQRAASAPATRSAPSSASSEAAWWRAASTATMSSPRTTISSEIPRWKRRPPNAATGPAAGRSRARGRSRCTPDCAGRRCRHAPWLCIAPGGAPRRTRAATGARPRGTASGRGPGRPALGRDEVTQAEQGEPEGEHPVDAIIAACPWLAVSAVPISYRSGPAGAA